jgi:hypothetical protein
VSDAATLGPMPEPEIEPCEPNPGGVDALPDDSGPILIPDLTPAENTALENKASAAVKQEVSQGEDTSTAATESAGDGQDTQPEKESPA